MRNKQKDLAEKKQSDIKNWLDVMVCSITEYFYLQFVFWLYLAILHTKMSNKIYVLSVEWSGFEEVANVYTQTSYCKVPGLEYKAIPENSSLVYLLPL